MILTAETVIARLEALTGAVVSDLKVLEGGISASSWLATVRVDEKKCKWVVRLPGDWRYSETEQPAAREFEVLQSLNSSQVKAPIPVAVEGNESREERKIYVLEFVEGSPLLAPSDIDSYLEQYASALAQIHQATPPSANLPVGKTGWNPEYAELNEALHEGLIRKTLADYRRTFDNAPALCHGDPWPGNVIWRDGTLQCFIDWEEVMICDPLYDVAVTRLELLWLLGPDAMQDWTSKFQRLSSASFAELPYWDLCATLRPIRWVEQWAPAFGKLGREDITAETMTAGLKWFIDDALLRATGSKP